VSRVLSHCPTCNKEWPCDMLQGEGCPSCTGGGAVSSITDCCPECGASLAECHIGDAVCPGCGAVVGDGGDYV
jgi:hypothetical protein